MVLQSQQREINGGPLDAIMIGRKDRDSRTFWKPVAHLKHVETPSRRLQPCTDSQPHRVNRVYEIHVAFPE